MARKARRQELINEIRKNFAEINVEYIGVNAEEIDTLQSFRKGFSKLTGTKNVRKVATGNLSKMNISKLEDVLAYQQKFLSNPYARKESREAIYKKALSSVKKTYGNVTQARFDRAISIFSSDVYKNLASKGKIVSDQIIDIVMSSRKSDTTINKALMEIADREDFDGLDRMEIGRMINEKLETKK